MFWMIVFGVLFGLTILFFGMLAASAIMDKREYGRAFPTRGMSQPACHLFMEYTALPKDSRPFPDIVSVLRDLDEYHSTDADINGHFDNPFVDRSAGYTFSWKTRCGHLNCRMSDYVDLHKAIESVSKALAAKEKALIEAKVAHRGESAKALAQALRDEAGIQRQVVEELAS